MMSRPGDVWLADLGLAAKTRPIVVISRYDSDPPRSLVVYVPLTTQYRSSRYEVPLPQLRFLDHKSVANVQGIGSIPAVRLERKIGRLPEYALTEIRDALMFLLDIQSGSQNGSVT